VPAEDEGSKRGAPKEKRQGVVPDPPPVEKKAKVPGGALGRKDRELRTLTFDHEGIGQKEGNTKGVYQQKSS